MFVVVAPVALAVLSFTEEWANTILSTFHHLDLPERVSVYCFPAIRLYVAFHFLSCTSIGAAPFHPQEVPPP